MRLNRSNVQLGSGWRPGGTIGRVADARMLLWELDEISGFDTAWVSVNGDRLSAEGQQTGLSPIPYWVRYRLTVIMVSGASARPV